MAGDGGPRGRGYVPIFPRVIDDFLCPSHPSRSLTVDEGHCPDIVLRAERPTVQAALVVAPTGLQITSREGGDSLIQKTSPQSFIAYGHPPLSPLVYINGGIEECFDRCC